MKDLNRRIDELRETINMCESSLYEKRNAPNVNAPSLDCRDFECLVCTKEVCCCVNPKQHLAYKFFKNVSNRGLMYMCSGDR